jgi:hypothetical protein
MSIILQGAERDCKVKVWVSSDLIWAKKNPTIEVGSSCYGVCGGKGFSSQGGAVRP